MLQNEKTSGKRKPAIEYCEDLLELHDAEPEEIARFGEELDDLWTVIAKIHRACEINYPFIIGSK